MQTTKGNWGKYILYTVLSILAALGNLGVAFVINQILRDFMGGSKVPTTEYFFYLAGSVVGYLLCRWFLSRGIIRFTQGLLATTRLEILKMVLRAPLSVMVKKKDKVLSALTNDTDNIVGAAISIVDIVTNSLVILICLLYMFILSWKLVLCIFGLLLFTLAIHLFTMEYTMRLFRAAMEQNDLFLRYLNEIIGGFKEICVAPAKGTGILDKHMYRATDQVRLLSQKAQLYMLNNKIMSTVFYYTFIALGLLYLGGLLHISQATLVSFIFVMLSIWGPIDSIIVLTPNLFKAKASFKRIGQLETEINHQPEHGPDSLAGPFERLELEEITFSYSGTEDNTASDFSVGPFCFHLIKGDSVFICGGNGSGKSTFIHLLTGLIQSGGGRIFVNDSLIGSGDMKAFRSLFAPVFADFFLFDQFYGMPDVDIAKAQEYLKLLGIEDKVSISKEGFSEVDLSTGQRKRLALLYALLEKRPILVLDEFAADQDPAFKKKFYKEIIPILRKDGFTLVLITHDDNYYQYADRLYKMDSGRLSEIGCLDKEIINFH